MDELTTSIIDILTNATVDQANSLVALALKVLVPFALLWLRNWYKAKLAEARANTQAIEDDSLRQGLNDALLRLENTADTVVAEIEATVKKFAENGKVINPQQLKTAAHGRIKSRLPSGSLELLQKTYGLEKLDSIVDSKVEKKALELKLARRRLVLRPSGALK